MNLDELREEIAKYSHESWSRWMQYLFEHSIRNPSDDSVTIPAKLVDRWTRQSSTPYDELPIDERQSDLKEADAILSIPIGGDNIKDVDGYYRPRLLKDVVEE